PLLTAAAALTAGSVISGVTGLAVAAAAIGVRYLLSTWPRYAESVTVGTVAGGLITAGAVLSRDPWRSVDGYIGHSAGVQFIALLSVAMLSASTVAMDPASTVAIDRETRTERT
ncbi:MAG: hypothetical protein WBN99_14250, partial [Mycobacterium sp.]